MGDILTKLVLQFFDSLRGLVNWFGIVLKTIGTGLDFLWKFEQRPFLKKSSWNNWIVL